MFSAIRNRLRLRSVRARLTFWYLLTLGTSLLAFAALVFAVRARALYHELDANLEVRVHEFATELGPRLLALDVAGALAADSVSTRGSLLVHQASRGNLFRSPGFPPVDWAGERTLAAAARDGTPLVTVSDRRGMPVRVATLIVDRPGAEPLALQLAASTDSVRNALSQLTGVMLTAIAVVLAAAGYGSGVTARRALAPVDEIVTRVHDIQAARLDERIDIRAESAELDRLVVTLNDMLDRIDASMRGARRFAADASHELQTPLTAMRNVVDACRRGTRGRADYEGMAVDLLAEIDRCSAIVRDLRLLALAEAGQLVTAPDCVDLAAIAVECGEIARAIAEDKQIRIELRAPDHPAVMGSPLHLRRVILNLTDNAIRYSPCASTVEIQVRHAGDRALLSVRDQGCGIAAEDLPHIFQPFYRTDRARARETGGTGLGLAIADQIVRAHGGQIRVASEPGLGSTFTVSLAAARRPAPHAHPARV